MLSNNGLLRSSLLGFTHLMDCRSVCRELHRQFEAAAVYYLEKHTVEEAQRERAEDSRWSRLIFHEEHRWYHDEGLDSDWEDGPRLMLPRTTKKEKKPDSDEDVDDERVEEEDAEDEEKMKAEMDCCPPSRPPPSHLSRGGAWTSDCCCPCAPFASVSSSIGGDCTERSGWTTRCEWPSVRWTPGWCTVTSPPRGAAFASHRPPPPHQLPPPHRHLATWLLRSDTAFADFDQTQPQRAREKEKERRAEMVSEAECQDPDEEVVHSRAATECWTRSSQAASLSHLPADVLVYFFLPCLDFEPLMDLRSVSRSFRQLCERAAVWWMNCRFPAGLAAIEQQERAEQRRREAEEADKREKKKRKGTKATGKRKRGSKEAQVPTEAAASASASLPSPMSAASAGASAVSYTPPTP